MAKLPITAPFTLATARRAPALRRVSPAHKVLLPNGRLVSRVDVAGKLETRGLAGTPRVTQTQAPVAIDRLGDAVHATDTRVKAAGYGLCDCLACLEGVGRG
jgi:hypothetical protein